MQNNPLPPCEGEFRIAADGQWWHDGQPMERVALAKLFSTILYNRGGQGYWLETPVERCPVEVEDLPFLAVEALWEKSILWFTTSLGERVPLDEEHPLVVDEKGPGIKVRGELWARVARPLYYRLVDEAVADGTQLYITSAGIAFSLGSL